MKQLVTAELYNELKLESIAIKIKDWVKQLVTAELYNELKLESIAIKIKDLR